MAFKLFSHREKKVSFHVWKDGAREQMHPARDWAVGFLGATVLFVLGLTYIAYDFHAQFGVPDTEVSAPHEPVVYQEKDVRLYAEIYAEKEELFNRLRDGN